jgi:hypothetical protein
VGFWLHPAKHAISINAKAADLNDDFDVSSFITTPPTSTSVHPTGFNPVKALGRDFPGQVSPWHTRRQKPTRAVIDPNPRNSHLLQAY